MAKQVQVQFVDDLDGGPADVADFPFSVDGKQYEIDLSNENVKQLREVLAPFVEAARRAGRTNRSAPVRPAGRKKETARIRAWALDNNWEVKDRGRIPAEVLEAYENRAGRP